MRENAHYLSCRYIVYVCVCNVPLFMAYPILGCEQPACLPPDHQSGPPPPPDTSGTEQRNRNPSTLRKQINKIQVKFQLDK